MVPLDERGRDNISSETYTPPRLVALGNLRDLVASGGTNSCDGNVLEAGPKDPDPATGNCV